MGKRNRAVEILEIKERGGKAMGLISLNLDPLLSEWRRISSNPDSKPDFYIIRAVTILEVFTRRRIGHLVDHDERFAGRAAALMKDYRIDFDTLKSIHGRVLTLGDIVANSVPVNSYGQIIAHFERLLDKKLPQLLAKAVDRWRTEVMKQSPEPIIPDYGGMAKTIGRLFEVRHILCHELPTKPVYTRDEVGQFLAESKHFVKAFENVLSFELYGDTGLNQRELRTREASRLREKERELDSFVAAIPDNVRLVDGELDMLLDSQKKWLSFRNAQCDFVTLRYKGGTIWSLLWSAQARALTEERSSELKRWLQSRSDS